MHRASILAVLVLASTSMAAQQSAPTSPTVLVAPPGSESCPVGFTAERRPQGAVVYARDAQAKPHGQGVHLSFSQRNTPGIVKASVIVHGYSNSSEVMPASTRSGNDLTETFELNLRPVANTQSSSNLWTRSMGGIRWVELTGIDYADGTSWHASANSQCRATPNGFLLVANNR